MGGAVRWVALAEVMRPHGVHGELRLRVFNSDSSVLDSRPQVRLTLPDGQVRIADVLGVRRVPGGLLARFSGVTDRDTAEALRGAHVAVERDALEPPEEGEYYFDDLERCVVMLDGAAHGVVKAVISYPTCDCLLVERSDGTRLEVPLHAQYIGTIDVDARRIELITLDGLEPAS